MFSRYVKKINAFSDLATAVKGVAAATCQAVIERSSVEEEEVVFAVGTPIFGVREQPEICDKAVDLMFVLDESGSIETGSRNGGTPNWNQMLEFVQKVTLGFTVSQKADESRVGLVTFGHEANVHFHLDTYESNTEVVAAVKKIP